MKRKPSCDYTRTYRETLEYELLRFALYSCSPLWRNI